jgi:electron transfer flavoprotein alpha subunit
VEIQKMAEYKGVAVLGEVNNGKLAGITTELLGGARKLANDLGKPLSVILIGNEVKGLAPEAIAFGANKVYIVESPALKDYQADAYLLAMEKATRQANPQVLLMGQTAIGRDLAPRLAFRLKTTATLDCVNLAIDPQSKRLLQTKPVYGGNAHAIFTSDSNPQVATVRAKTMSPLPYDQSRKGEVVEIRLDIDPLTLKTKYIQKVAQAVEGIRLEDARLVVSGGRGIGGPDGFKQLEELAKLLKGAVGASRPACDNGWVPDVLLVGLTGKIIAPEVYIAIGISGSSQHLAGCSTAKNIIAINKDPEANIIKQARYCVVGDWHKVLPAFTAKVKELLAG